MRIILILSFACLCTVEGVLRDAGTVLDCSQAAVGKVVDDQLKDPEEKSFQSLLEDIKGYPLNKVKIFSLNGQELSDYSLDQILGFTTRDKMPKLREVNLFGCDLSLNGVFKLLTSLEVDNLDWINVASNRVHQGDIAPLCRNLGEGFLERWKKVIIIEPSYIDVWQLGGDIFKEQIDAKIFPKQWAAYHRKYYITHSPLKEKWEALQVKKSKDFWAIHREEIIDFYVSSPH